MGRKPLDDDVCGHQIYRVSERGTNPYTFKCALEYGHFGPHKSARQIRLERKAATPKGK